jgi:hypothetical protein
MRQFLRLLAIILLLFVGFGTGIGGLAGIGSVLASSNGFNGIVIALSLLGLTLSAACIRGIRALARRLHAQPARSVEPSTSGTLRARHADAPGGAMTGGALADSTTHRREIVARRAACGSSPY